MGDQKVKVEIALGGYCPDCGRRMEAVHILDLSDVADVEDVEDVEDVANASFDNNFEIACNVENLIADLVNWDWKIIDEESDGSN